MLVSTICDEWREWESFDGFVKLFLLDFSLLQFDKFSVVLKKKIAFGICL